MILKTSDYDHIKEKISIIKVCTIQFHCYSDFEDSLNKDQWMTGRYLIISIYGIGRYQVRLRLLQYSLEE